VQAAATEGADIAPLQGKHSSMRKRRNKALDYSVISKKVFNSVGLLPYSALHSKRMLQAPIDVLKN
jgi:hypothetical protein